MRLTLKPDQVPDVVDALLSECGPEDRSVPRLIALIREKTRTDRSDADLEALVAKKAAVRGIAMRGDTSPNQ